MKTHLLNRYERNMFYIKLRNMCYIKLSIRLTLRIIKVLEQLLLRRVLFMGVKKMERLFFCSFLFLSTATLSSGTIRLVSDEIYELLIEAVQNGVHVPFSRSNPSERKVYDLQRKFRFEFEEVFNMISGRVERMLVGHINNQQMIFPMLNECENIISFFYQTYKGGGPRKLARRIQRTYAGFSRDSINEFLNQNEFRPV